MSEQAALIARGLAVTTPNYAPKLVLARGKGSRVWDVDGVEYVDLLAGIAVNVLGHCHPTYVERVSAQLRELLQVSNIFFSQPQIALSERLIAKTFADRVFFANSGAEANEAALKLARRYQRFVKNSKRFEIVAMRNSFHGRTMFSLAATGQPKYHKGFEPMVPGFLYADFNDITDVERQIGPNTAAVIVEPIQGEGGVVMADPDFLAGLRALCDREGALLIFDEVQTGMGRTGTLFAYEQMGVTPDVLTTAKGLGGGLPIGAMLCRSDVAAGFVPGSHATTFGGNPVVTAAGLAVMDIIESEGLLARAQEASNRLTDGLQSLASRHDRLGGVRGLGLMLGIACEGDLTALTTASRECGLLHNTAGGVVLRFLPALNVTDADIDDGLGRLDTALLRVQ